MNLLQGREDKSSHIAFPFNGSWLTFSYLCFSGTGKGLFQIVNNILYVFNPYR
jgi:hypothetical protein